MYKLSIFLLSSMFLFSSCDSTDKDKKSTVKEMTTNPLLVKWDTPFGVPPFDKIKSADYLPALIF